MTDRKGVLLTFMHQDFVCFIRFKAMRQPVFDVGMNGLIICSDLGLTQPLDEKNKPSLKNIQGAVQGVGWGVSCQVPVR